MNEDRRKLLQDAFSRAEKKYKEVHPVKDDNVVFYRHSGRVYCGMSLCLGFISLDCTLHQWNTICDVFSSLGLDILSDLSFQDYSEYETEKFEASWHKIAQPRKSESYQQSL